MNDETPINPIQQGWLTAYADGQLDAPTRCRVAAWLLENAETLTELENQEYLSPTNVDYWKSVAPPLPSEERWDQALSNISDMVLPAICQPAVCKPAVGRSHRIVSRSLALAGAAAILLVAILAFDRQKSANRPNKSSFPNEASEQALNHENDDEDMVFKVASADDVELIQLPESAAPNVVVGRHPMADVPLLLASAGDLQLLSYGPDDQGNLPDFESLGPNASMLWAPSTKP